MNSSNNERRNFLKNAAAAAAGSLLAGSPALASIAEQEDPWRKVAGEYTPSNQLLNLNNAGVSPQPKIVQEAMIRAYRFANELPDVNMWEVLDGSRARIKEKLAQLAGCDPGEIALNRNATEGLCTAIYGIDLRAGDEVILCDWDYDSMRHAWEQRAKRNGITLKVVSFDLLSDDEAIIEAYRRAFTSRTRVMHLTHMLHYTGRVLPVEALCGLARERGVQTIVDAAQSFAQLPLNFRDIGCDYLAVSLHKWLCAPFGTGMLIVKSSRIEALWPLLSPYEAAPKGIDKLDGSSVGTYSSPAERAIESAIDFHNALGTAAIHARLRHLSRYWIDRAKDIRGFRLHTPIQDARTAAVTLFSITGMEAEAIEKRLRAEHGIRVRFRKRGSLTGVRISPHIYTVTADLDRFVAALRSVAARA